MKVPFTWNDLIRLGLTGLFYAALTVVTFALAFLLRLDFEFQGRFKDSFWPLMLWVVPLRILCLAFFDQFKLVVRSFGSRDLPKLLFGVGVSSAVILLVRLVAGSEIGLPRTVPIIEGILFIGTVGFSRLLIREIPVWFNQRSGECQQVVILGAGRAGEHLLEQLRRHRAERYRVIAFFDDNLKLNQRVLRGLKIHAPIERLRDFVETHRVDQAIVAMPSAPGKRVQEVFEFAKKIGLDCVQVPPLVDILLGKNSIDTFKKLEPEDFLKREPITIDVEHLRAAFAGKRVLVTGGAGSIGSEICRQLISLGAAKVVAVDRSEESVFHLLNSVKDGRLRTALEDITISNSLIPILEAEEIEVCFHAAAFKHVPLMEIHPAQAFINNCIGTLNTLNQCEAAGVKRFGFISTDKVVEPTSVMGVTKFVAERLAIGGDWKMECFAVRFGNVLDSSGSVIPTFKKQIAAGGPVTVTDPRVTRYFMTIPEAVGLVLNAAIFARAGDVFLLDMGEPIRIEELARKLIEAHSLRPEIDIKIVFTGLRPGEKLHEKLSYPTENLVQTDNPKIWRCVGEDGRRNIEVECWPELAKTLKTLEPEAGRQRLFQLSGLEDRNAHLG
ncbi:MAG: SDR family NAD(P)-dependent oxidoreductase [Puniceicoccaceae bacterium]